MKLYPEFFNDVFGPIMQPGSSSHTAAPCRMGYLANNLLGETPEKIEIVLDKDGSFSGTFGIMNEDGGMLAGAMGFLPDDKRIFSIREILKENKIEYKFNFSEMKESNHINAMKFILTGKSGKAVSIVGDSTGGGMIETKIINGFPLRLKGDTFVALIFSKNNNFEEIVKEIKTNIEDTVDEGLVESEEQGFLYYLKTSESIDIEKIKYDRSQYSIKLLPPILPVITKSTKKPQLFTTMTQWREIARMQNKKLWEIAVQYEIDASGWTAEQVIEYMKKVRDKMHRQTHAAYEEELPEIDNPYLVNHTQEWKEYIDAKKNITCDTSALAIKLAWGAGFNIPGVEIVPGPMGTGGGFIYAALFAVKSLKGFSDDDLLRGLFIAAGIGALAYTRTGPTGEVIGCTGECGMCGAMAAAAVTEMIGGTPEQVEAAASMSLQSTIGMPCDPIPGGKGAPCYNRVMASTCMAIVFADVALSGRDSILPLHEVIDVADTVGKNLPPELLCTSRGGTCTAPTAKEVSKDFFEWYERKNQ